MKVARGTVLDRPWGVTLGTLGVRQVTGQLDVHGEDGKIYSVAFIEGRVVAAQSPLASDSLARIALTSHLVSSTQVAEITRRLAAAPERDEIDVLADAARLGPELVEPLRRRVIAQRAARTFSLDRGTYVVDDELLLPLEPPCEVDVRAVVYQGVRKHLSEQRLGDDLRELGSRFVLKPGGRETVSAYGFTDEERPILDALLGGTSLAELAASHRDIEPRVVQAVIYALVACGACEGTGGRPAEPRPAASGPAVTRTATLSTPAIERNTSRMPNLSRTATSPAIARTGTAARSPDDVVVFRTPTKQPPVAPASHHDSAPTRAPTRPDAPSTTRTADHASSPPSSPSPSTRANTRDPAVTRTPTQPPRQPRAPTLPPPQPRAPTLPPMQSRAPTQPPPQPRAPTQPPPPRATTTTRDPVTPRARTSSGVSQPRAPTVPGGSPTRTATGTGTGPSPALPRTPTPSLPRTTTGRAFAAREAETLVAGRSALMEQGADHFAMLGIAFDAPIETARTAYLQLARQLHPDKLVELGVSDETTHAAQRVFAQVNAAFATLTEPTRRNEYLAGLTRGVPTPLAPRVKTGDAIDKVAAAEEAFRRGDAALRREDLTTAVLELAKSVELNPSNVDYQTLHAWAAFCAATDKPAIAAEIRKTLEKSVLRAANPLMPRFYLGRVERMLGRDREALRHFQEVIELQPNHAAAASEIRIIEARLAASPDKGHGLFGRKR